MKIEKEFEGVLKIDGDDGYCFGMHLCFPKTKQNVEIKEFQVTYGELDTSVISYLDKIAEENEGKKAKIKIIVEIE